MNALVIYEYVGEYEIQDVEILNVIQLENDTYTDAELKAIVKDLYPRTKVEYNILPIRKVTQKTVKKWDIESW